MRTDLRPEFDSRASFYGKAIVEQTETYILLWSYNTKVAQIEKETNELVVFDTYSSTTLRHIKEFLLQNGFVAKNKAQIIKDYVKVQE